MQIEISVGQFSICIILKQILSLKSFTYNIQIDETVACLCISKIYSTSEKDLKKICYIDMFTFGSAKTFHKLSSNSNSHKPVFTNNHSKQFAKKLWCCVGTDSAHWQIQYCCYFAPYL